MRHRFVAALALLAAASAAAGKDLAEAVNKDGSNVALKGYDPVAYFEQGNALKGTTRYTYSWMNATWRFSSTENRDKFAADPARYAPQFGGYCAWAVSKGYTAPVDPEAWKIIGGKLYLNYSKSVREQWLADVNQRIADGEKNWPRLHK